MSAVPPDWASDAWPVDQHGEACEGTPSNGGASTLATQANGKVGPLTSLRGVNLPIGGGTLPYTDTGNASRLLQRHATQLRFVPLWRKWLAWDGRRWAIDHAGCRVQALAKETFLEMFDQARRQLEDLKGVPEDSKGIKNSIMRTLTWALKSQDLGKINSAIQLARSDQRVMAAHTDLDTDPLLFNVRNGTIDLRTGKLRSHWHEDLITKLADVEFNPSAKCPMWDRFLQRAMDGKQELIDYLRRAVGYSLTGTVGEQCLFFLHGDGANGKSVFLGSIQNIMGDYGATAAPDLLMARNGEAHPTGVADLHGKRFVATIEVEDGRRLAESLVKQLTGGDPVKARRMKEDFWGFLPTWKIWLAANSKPVIRGQDYAIWRRFRLIPFTVTIPPDERDRGLAEKLKAEAAGILAWAVRGCLEWQRTGLAEPEEVKAATEEYRAEQDQVQEWIDTYCVRGGADFRIKKPDAYGFFKKWMEDQGERGMSNKRFGMELRRLGIVEDDGRRWYVGFAIRHDEDLR